ncbi:MAG: hypothetical protein J6X79_01335 [Bacteroidales bacterium]|nr:hypothetical protein [Bacteroidales bacterium]
MTEKKEYVAPKLTVVSFKMEKGYASSIVDMVTFWDNSQDANQMESYETGNGWNTGSNAFWD